MKTSTVAWIVIIILIIAGGAWYFVSANNSALPTDQTQTDTTGATNTDTSGIGATVGVSTGTPKTITVAYTAQGFSPANVTINKGDTINFVASGGQFWVASDPHPVHTAYDGTSRDQHCAAGYTGPKPLDECAPGTSFSFTFDKVGTFGYHDHLIDENKGSVTVQ